MTDLTEIPGGKGEELDAVRLAAHNLADAKTLFARTFLLAKASAPRDKPLTDRLAHELAVEATKDEVTVLQAELDIALHNLRSSQ